MFLETIKDQRRILEFSQNEKAILKHDTSGNTTKQNISRFVNRQKLNIPPHTISKGKRQRTNWVKVFATKG